VLAASIMIRHVADDPVRAVVLAWRALPAPLRGCLRAAGPYGRAATLWGAGEGRAALAVLGASPRRLAAFSLAVDQPRVARDALARVPGHGPGGQARKRLAARLAQREGRLTDALRALDGARGWRARRLRRMIGAEQALLEPGTVRLGPGALASGGHGTPGRVLHLVNDALPTTNAGYTVRTQEIALAQRAAGMDPHVVTRIGFPVTDGTLDGRPLVTIDGVPYHRLLPWLMPQLADAAAQRGAELAAALTARLRPAVLHAASNYANALTGIALREASGLPLVYEVRGFWEDTWLSRHAGDGVGDGPDLADSERYRLSRDLETWCMRQADLVVTLGEAMREEILSRGVPRDKVIIVPNAVSGDFLRPLPEGGALRAGLGIRPGERVVGLVSSLAAHEGIGTLLEATAILTERGLPVRALIVGDGPERAALQRQAAALGLDAIFTGRVPVSKVREFHAVLDVFVVPRTRDRVCQLVTPLKPVEAMASGLPVVVSGVRALAEIVKDGVTGMLATPQDPVSLAERLERLLGDPGLRAKLGAAAREWVAADRTWAQNAARYRDAYARLGAL